MILFVIACTAIGYLATYEAPKVYAATATVQPVSDRPPEKGGALEIISKNISEMASASIDTDAKKMEAIAILQSDELFRRYIARNNLLPILFADRWDSARGRWRTATYEQVPTLWVASEFFRRYVCKVQSDPETGLVSLTVRWTDPILVATWANGLIEMANEMQRETTIAQSDRSVAYLTDAAARTDKLATKKLMYSLIESELNKTMLAKGNPDFAFKFIDPAVVPEKYVRPAKLIWLLSSAACSLSVAIFAAFCLVAWCKR